MCSQGGSCRARCAESPCPQAPVRSCSNGTVGCLAPHATRLAGPDDAAVIGRLLHDFNAEYDEPSPGPEAMAARVRELLESGDATVLLVGDGPDGLALMRFRPWLWKA